MATRAELHEKYGIYRLMKPDIANKELTQEEAEMCEKFLQVSRECFDNLNNDDSGDIE